MRNLEVSASPHIHGNGSTTKIMLMVIIAMLPAAAASCAIFGMRCLLVIGVCVSFCVLFELMWAVIMKKPAEIKDLSAVVTGMLLAFNLPSTIPLWQAAIGSLVAIVVVKQLFGGIGCNFANPALVGRVVLSLSFTGAMTNYGAPRFMFVGWQPFYVNIDAISSATPLTQIAAGEAGALTWQNLFFGTHSGVLGETCVAALLLGGVILIIARVINPIIPLTFIGTVFGMTALLGTSPLYSVMSGGLVLGAIFMATDYVTSPYTNWGKVIFGVGCGALTVVIRLYANSAEGVSFAILIMNLLVPYINNITRRRPFGGEAA